MTRDDIRAMIVSASTELHLMTDADVDAFTDMVVSIAQQYNRPEFDETAWFGDFFLGVLLAASLEGSYTVTQR